MDLDLVFNELSVEFPASDIWTAKRWMSNLLSTIQAAIEHGVNRVLRTHRDFHAIMLAPDYPLARWRNDLNVDKEKRRYFNYRITQYPFIVDLHNSEIKENFLLYEFSHEGDEAEGLGYAYLLEALAVSVRSEERWESSILELEAKQLDDDGNLTIDKVKVIHASHPNHVVENGKWIKNRLQQGVRDGDNLWNRKHELFPSLSFCEGVVTQIRELRIGNPMLRVVVKRLFELEDYCKNWHEGPFNPDNLPTKVTPESQVTLQQFGGERTFLCPDGQKRIFSWHVRLTPAAWRIYFFPEEGIKEIIIGYIGPHLPTARYPT